MDPIVTPALTAHIAGALEAMPATAGLASVAPSRTAFIVLQPSYACSPARVPYNTGSIGPRATDGAFSIATDAPVGSADVSLSAASAGTAIRVIPSDAARKARTMFMSP